MGTRLLSSRFTVHGSRSSSGFTYSAGAESGALGGGGRVELDAVLARDLGDPRAVGQVVDAQAAVAYDGSKHVGGGRRGLLLLLSRVEWLSRRALRAEEGARARVVERGGAVRGRECRSASGRGGRGSRRHGLRLVDRAEEAVEDEEHRDEHEGDYHPADGASAERAPDFAEEEVVERYPPD